MQVSTVRTRSFGDILPVTGRRLAFGAAVITDVTLTGFEHDVRGDESPRLLRPGWVSMAFVVSGAMRVMLGGETYFFVAGSAAVLPSPQLPDLLCGDPTRVLIVSVDASGGAFDGLLPNRIVALSAAVVRTHPAVAFFEALLETPDIHPAETAPVREILCRLMTGLMEADLDWRTRPERPELAHILELIEERYTDSGFDRRALARANHMSPRALDHLLLEQNEKKGAEELIAERRIVAAASHLRPGRCPAVEELAERTGFPSAAALDTMVARVYGVSATRLLATLQPAAA